MTERGKPPSRRAIASSRRSWRVLGWQESDLASPRQAHPDKLAIALRLRNETTLSIKWIAARVRIGSSKGANSVLHPWVHGRDKTAAVQPKACAQLEFQSTVWPLSPGSNRNLILNARRRNVH